LFRLADSFLFVQLTRNRTRTPTSLTRISREIQVWGNLRNTKNGTHGRPSSPVEQTFRFSCSNCLRSSSIPRIFWRETIPLFRLVPWLQGMLTGLLGNLSLLSYFAKKREKEAAVVQTLGVVSTHIVLAQLTMAEAMPIQYFVATSAVVTIGLIVNCLYYFGKLSKTVWQLWEDVITIGGLSVLPQIMWSTFVPLVPNSILPGTTAFGIAVAAIIMARTGKLSEKGVRFVGSLSGWTATLMFMWMPVSQMWTNFLNPDNIKGLSSITMLLSMMGNGLMIPRALFIRDLMWLTGSLWATLFYGYGNILCLYLVNCTSQSFFVAATIGLISWIGLALWRDAVAYGHNSPFRSLKELVFGP